MEEISEDFKHLYLEEYRALRAENLRCAQVISNASWIGLSGFMLTIAAGATLLKDHTELLPNATVIIAILISLQALGASVMFLSETFKYVRIGVYLQRIEKLVSSSYSPHVLSKMYWEHWIRDIRAEELYIVQFLILQLPIGFLFFLHVLIVYSHISSALSSYNFLPSIQWKLLQSTVMCLQNHQLLIVFSFLIMIADAISMYRIITKISKIRKEKWCEIKKYFEVPT